MIVTEAIIAKWASSGNWYQRMPRSGVADAASAEATTTLAVLHRVWRQQVTLNTWTTIIPGYETPPFSAK